AATLPLRGRDYPSALHQHRAGALRTLVLAHDAEAPGDFGIGLHEPAEVAAEAVDVELLVRLDVRQATRIRGNLVGNDDAHHVVFPQPAAFHLEVDEADADAEEDPREEVVHPDRERHDVVDLLRRRPAEGGDVLLGHHRVAETVVLVIELDDRARQLGPFSHAGALGKRARRDVAHHHHERDDLDLADQLLAHVQPPDEVRRHADVVEVLEYVFRNAVVEHALAFDHLVLFRIEGGGVVLEVLDQGAGLRALVEDLRLAFIDTAATAHRRVPWLEEIHLCRGSCEYAVRGGGGGTTRALKCCPTASET